MSVPINIREYRKKSGYTQKQTAEYLQISERAYQHYEAGTRKIPLELLKELSKLFHEPIDTLVGNTVDFHPKENDPPFGLPESYKEFYRHLANEPLTPAQDLSSIDTRGMDPDDAFEAIADCNEHNFQVYVAKIYRLMDEVGIDKKHFDDLKNYLDYLRYLDR